MSDVTWPEVFTRRLPDEKILRVSYALTRFRSGELYCKLCDGAVPVGESANVHMGRHKQELREWRRLRDAEARAEARRLKREVERERRLAARVLGE